MLKMELSATPTTPISTSISTMPNVEHLLQHYKVADVLHIQKRLKGDVEKRKADLKALIGERYNELLEATDSIEQMSGSVSSLIVSLKELSGVLGSCTTTATAASTKKEVVEEQLKNSSRTDAAEYNEAVLSKLLFDLPLQMWNALEQGRVTFATYSYFYGLYLYRKLPKQQQQKSGHYHRLHFYNQRAIEDMAGYIVEHCWQRIASEQRLSSSEVDLSTFADTFSCIYLLESTRESDQNHQLDKIELLVEEFYQRQAANINAVCSSPQENSLSLSALLETLLNIITNTVKCSRVFYSEEGDTTSSALLPQRFHRLITSSYSSFTSSSRLNHQQQLPFQAKNSRHHLHHLQQYQIASDFETLQLQLCPKAADAIGAWVTTVTAQLTSTLQAKVEEGDSAASIRALYSELEATEERLLSGAAFREWEEEYGTGVMDIREVVWTAAIKRAVFERRVQALAAAKIGEAVREVEERLLMAEAEALKTGGEQQTSNFAEAFFWRSTTTNNSSHFQTLITACYDLLEGHLSSLYEDVAPLKQASTGSNFLTDLLTGQLFTALLADLQQRVNRLHLSSTSSNQWLLFGALFFEKLSAEETSCPQQQPSKQTSTTSSYRKLFEDLSQPQQQQNQNRNTSWTTVQTELRRISDSYFCRWFELVVGGHLTTFTPEVLVELTSFLGNLTAWQRVPITGENSTSSAVEVPTTISLRLQSVLESVCGDINRQSGYRLSAPVLHFIVSLLSERVITVYETAIKGRLLEEGQPCFNYPPAAKQTIAVQLYFDLLFLRSCLSSEPEFQKQSSPQLKRLNELKAIFEGGSSLIDPFDLHLMFPALVANAERHLKASSVLFAFLFSSSTSTTVNKTSSTEAPSNQTAVRHNIMLVVPPQQQ